MAQAGFTPAEQVQSYNGPPFKKAGRLRKQKQLDEVHIAIVGDVEE